MCRNDIEMAKLDGDRACIDKIVNWLQLFLFCCHSSTAALCSNAQGIFMAWTELLLRTCIQPTRGFSKNQRQHNPKNILGCFHRDQACFCLSACCALFSASLCG